MLARSGRLSGDRTTTQARPKDSSSTLVHFFTPRPRTRRQALRCPCILALVLVKALAVSAVSGRTGQRSEAAESGLRSRRSGFDDVDPQRPPASLHYNVLPDPRIYQCVPSAPLFCSVVQVANDRSFADIDELRPVCCPASTPLKPTPCLPPTRRFFTLSHIVAPGETISSSSLTRRPGGKGANQACSVARSSAGQVTRPSSPLARVRSP